MPSLAIAPGLAATPSHALVGVAEFVFVLPFLHLGDISALAAAVWEQGMSKGEGAGSVRKGKG